MPDYPFLKGHGTENDFVLLPDHDGSVHGALSDQQLADRVRALCDRRAGIGGDGVLRVVRDGEQWSMDYRNADGSLSEMCGNGIRVFARYLIENGLATLEPGDTLAIGTRAGVRDVQRNLSGFQVDLGRWSLDGGEPLVRARNLSVARPGLGINVGNPHVVVALASDDELDSADLSYIPQLDPEPEAGANVEFVVPADPMVKDGVGYIRMRVHERGSGETLSCGTGAAAAALATRHWAGAGAPNQWKVQFRMEGLACACSPRRTASTSG